tara:strand:+ start:2609 stop:2746 length:138 start_codon:yes stop_codon:yes gene_type:complete
MNKRQHIFASEIKLDAEYIYDKNDKKVYDVKKLKREFNAILKQMK